MTVQIAMGLLFMNNDNTLLIDTFLSDKWLVRIGIPHHWWRKSGSVYATVASSGTKLWCYAFATDATIVSLKTASNDSMPIGIARYSCSTIILALQSPLCIHLLLNVNG